MQSIVAICFLSLDRTFNSEVISTLGCVNLMILKVFFPRWCWLLRGWKEWDGTIVLVL